MHANVLINYDSEDLFTDICECGVFDDFKEYLDEDTYNDLLNEINYYISTLEYKKP